MHEDKLFYFFISFLNVKEIARAKTCDVSCVHYLPLINRAGGLYGRILTEVVRSVLTTEVKILTYRPTKLG